MKLTFTEGASTWEAVGEYIPDGVYKMTEFGVDDMEDGHNERTWPVSSRPVRCFITCLLYSDPISSPSLWIGWVRSIQLDNKDSGVS